MKVISFYSNPPKTTYYSDHAKQWIKNIESFKLDYHIEELKSDKDYWKNTRKKPSYILDKLNIDQPDWSVLNNINEILIDIHRAATALINYKDTQTKIDFNFDDTKF